MSRPDRLTCEQMFERLDDYLDRELAPGEMAAAHAHLEACAVCAGEYRFDETVLRRVRERLARNEPPAGLLGAIRGRLGTSGD
jgi:anti-sigma factor RsiW